MNIIAGYQNDIPSHRGISRRAVFVNTVSEIAAYFDDGSIPNQKYIEAKETFNRVLADAERIISGKYSFWNESQSVRDFQSMFGCIYIHMIPGILKKIAKIKNPECTNHPYYIEMCAMLNDWVQIVEMMLVLKDKTTKRQPKPVEEQKEGYHPPKVSNAYEQMVVTLLEDVTENDYQALKGLFRDSILRQYESFQNSLVSNPKNTPYNFFIKDNKHPNYYMCQIIEDILKNKNSENVIDKEVTKRADEYRTSFVHKNFRKIASIIEAKGGYKAAEKISHFVSLTGWVGTFRFYFEDGSAFTVVNKVVYSYSSRGNDFMRFPLTFHNVYLSNGVRMKSPSEEKMNKEFV